MNAPVAPIDVSSLFKRIKRLEEGLIDVERWCREGTSLDAIRHLAIATLDFPDEKEDDSES